MHPKMNALLRSLILFISIKNCNLFKQGNHVLRKTVMSFVKQLHRYENKLQSDIKCINQQKFRLKSKILILDIEHSGTLWEPCHISASCDSPLDSSCSEDIVTGVTVFCQSNVQYSVKLQTSACDILPFSLPYD